MKWHMCKIDPDYASRSFRFCKRLRFRAGEDAELVVFDGRLGWFKLTIEEAKGLVELVEPDSDFSQSAIESAYRCAVRESRRYESSWLHKVFPSLFLQRRPSLNASWNYKYYEVSE